MKKVGELFPNWPTKHQYRLAWEGWRCVHCGDVKLVDEGPLLAYPAEMARCDRSPVHFTFVEWLGLGVNCVFRK